MKFSEYLTYVFDEYSNALITDGFKSNVSKRTLKFQQKNYSYELHLSANNYLPNSVDFKFMLIVKLPEIFKIVEDFLKWSGERGDSTVQTIIFEADFIPETKYLEYKYRSNYCHSVLSQDQLIEHTDKSTKRLKNIVLPAVMKIQSIESFLDYYYNDYNKIAAHLYCNQFFISFLIATKLKRPESFMELVQKIESSINELDEESGYKSVSLLNCLQKLVEYQI